VEARRLWLVQIQPRLQNEKLSQKGNKREGIRKDGKGRGRETKIDHKRRHNIKGI
jgi:hypothetical protein